MIITLTQVKSLLNISGTAKDTLISAMIPEAESKYLQIRNIPFLQIQATATATDKTIKDIVIYPYSNLYTNCEDFGSVPVKHLDRMDYVFGNGIDNYITDIDIYNNTIEIDIAPSATVTNGIFTIYPQGAKLTAAKMINYLMSSNSFSGLSSESVGSYSWSAKGTGNPFGVPDDIFKSIKRYIRA